MARKKGEEVTLQDKIEELDIKKDELYPELTGISEDDEEICGCKVNKGDLRCCSCTNPVTGTNSLDHANFHVCECEDKTVILCSDCDRKFKDNPQITPAFYVIAQDGKLIQVRWG